MYLSALCAQNDARGNVSATDEDDEDDGRGGAQRVQCAHQ